MQKQIEDLNNVNSDISQLKQNPISNSKEAAEKESKPDDFDIKIFDILQQLDSHLNILSNKKNTLHLNFGMGYILKKNEINIIKQDIDINFDKVKNIHTFLSQNLNLLKSNIPYRYCFEIYQYCYTILVFINQREIEILKHFWTDTILNKNKERLKKKVQVENELQKLIKKIEKNSPKNTRLNKIISDDKNNIINLRDENNVLQLEYDKLYKEYLSLITKIKNVIKEENLKTEQFYNFIKDSYECYFLNQFFCDNTQINSNFEKYEFEESIGLSLNKFNNEIIVYEQNRGLINFHAKDITPKDFEITRYKKFIHSENILSYDEILEAIKTRSYPEFTPKDYTRELVDGYWDDLSLNSFEKLYWLFKNTLKNNKEVSSKIHHTIDCMLKNTKQNSIKIDIRKLMQLYQDLLTHVDKKELICRFSEVLQHTSLNKKSKTDFLTFISKLLEENYDFEIRLCIQKTLAHHQQIHQSFSLIINSIIKNYDASLMLFKADHLVDFYIMSIYFNDDPIKNFIKYFKNYIKSELKINVQEITLFYSMIENFDMLTSDIAINILKALIRTEFKEHLKSKEILISIILDCIKTIDYTDKAYESALFNFYECAKRLTSNISVVELYCNKQQNMFNNHDIINCIEIFKKEISMSYSSSSASSVHEEFNIHNFFNFYKKINRFIEEKDRDFLNNSCIEIFSLKINKLEDMYLIEEKNLNCHDFKHTRRIESKKIKPTLLRQVAFFKIGLFPRHSTDAAANKAASQSQIINALDLAGHNYQDFSFIIRGLNKIDELKNAKPIGAKFYHTTSDTAPQQESERYDPHSDLVLYLH